MCTRGDHLVHTTLTVSLSRLLQYLSALQLLIVAGSKSMYARNILSVPRDANLVVTVNEVTKVFSFCSSKLGSNSFTGQAHQVSAQGLFREDS